MENANGAPDARRAASGMPDGARSDSTGDMASPQTGVKLMSKNDRTDFEQFATRCDASGLCLIALATRATLWLDSFNVTQFSCGLAVGMTIAAALSIFTW